MRLPELTVKRKIVVTFALLSSAIIVASFLVTYGQLQKAEQGRGNFLRKHYERFDAYRQGIGESMAAAASFVASDPAIVAVLGPPTATGIPIVPGGADAVLGRAREALEETLGTEFLVVLDHRGRLVLAAGDVPFDERDVAEGKYFADVREGIVVRAAVVVTSKGVYQVSGVPVKNAADDVIGSLTVGVTLDRYFEEFRKQSDRDPMKQHRLSFVREGRVLASVFPSGEREPLAGALDRDAWIQEREGEDTVDVILLGDRKFDFYEEAVQGYAGNEAGEIGRIFLMRNRTFKEEERGEKFKEMWIPFGSILLGAIIIGWLFSLLITRPLDKFVRATETISKGEADLTQRIDVRSRDEMGRLATNLNALFASLQKLAKSVQRTSFHVASSSAQISAASRQMLDGAKDQAGKVQGSSAAVTELSSSIQHVAENAIEATKVAKQSGEAVTRAIDRMRRIQVTVEQAAERILDLGESGKRIGNIVEVIRQISEQTSLLALNASIEAAHAGEQGRGFAVVADEVSSLARRVGQSARDIEDLIATIKDQTAEAVRTMQAGTREVEEGTTLVATTLGDLKKISEVVAYTAQAVQEQAVASDEIARNMDAVQRIAQDVVTSSEEAVVQGEHLNQLAASLSESVRGFKVDRDGEQAGDSASLPPTTDKRLPERRS